MVTAACDILIGRILRDGLDRLANAQRGTLTGGMGILPMRHGLEEAPIPIHRDWRPQARVTPPAAEQD